MAAQRNAANSDKRKLPAWPLLPHHRVIRRKNDSTGHRRAVIKKATTSVERVSKFDSRIDLLLIPTATTTSVGLPGSMRPFTVFNLAFSDDMENGVDCEEDGDMPGLVVKDHLAKKEGDFDGDDEMDMGSGVYEKGMHGALDCQGHVAGPGHADGRSEV